MSIATSAPEQRAVPVQIPRLLEDLIAIASLATREVSSAAELEANLKGVYTRAYATDLANYDVAEVIEYASNLQRLVFNLRVDLKNRAVGWQQQGYMTRPVQDALRDVLRISRYANDIFGEIATNHPRLGEGEQSYRAFGGPPEMTLINPNFGQVSFQSGDVVLVRGMLHNSAAIARSGDVDTQYSHVGIVHVHPKTGVKSMVEALIEEGALINQLDHALAHSVGRAALYRHHDRALAERAADAIYWHVKRSRSFGGTIIPYDFSMQLGSYKELFCSKLIRLAFDKGSRGKIKLPTFKTQFGMKNRDFFKRIGVKATETFAPGDLEIEPGFDLVAEWQDYRVTSRMRLQDLAMTKLFEWSERDDLRYHEDFKVRLISLFGRLSSYLSDDAKNMVRSVVPKVPNNMRRSAIAAVAMLHYTAEPLLLGLIAKEEAHIDATGRPLSVRAVYAALEEVRAQHQDRVGYLRRPGS